VSNETPAWQGVYADDALSRGLAIFTGANPLTVPESASQWQQVSKLHQKQLMVMNDISTAVKHGDMASWQSLVTQFNDNWIVPLLSALKRGELQTLQVYEGNGRCYRITDKMAKRWWKRTASLHRCI
jgi:hypothetical protein